MECSTASWCSYITRRSRGDSPPVWRSRRRRTSHIPTTAATTVVAATSRISGSCAYQFSASVCCVMPAETSPTIRPSDAYTGATARIDGPSVPVKTSVNVSPRNAGSVVPRYFWPISDGSVCV